MMENREGRDRMAAAALERVKSLGGWDRYGDQVDAVYRELVTRHAIRLREAS